MTRLCRFHHRWKFIPMRGQVFPVFSCVDCRMWSWESRWFPDRFRWFEGLYRWFGRNR